MKPIISTLLTLCVGFNASLAQQSLTLEQCRQMALQSSENIKIADKQFEQAVAEKQAAFAAYLPKISATGSLTYAFKDIEMNSYLPTFVPDIATAQLKPNLMPNPIPGATTPVIGPDGNPVFDMYAYYPLEVSVRGAYMAGVTVEQPIFAGGKIIVGNKMAKVGTEIASENRALQQASVIAETDRAYWIYVAVGEKVKILEKYSALLDFLDSATAVGYAVEMASKNDLLKVQARRGAVRYDLQRARNGLELARMSLCRITGLDYEAQILPADSLTQAALTQLPEASSDVTNRPEYRILQRQVDMKALHAKMVRADFLPVVGLGAGYSYLNGAKISGQEMSLKLPYAMLSVSIPLFHFGEGFKKIKSARLQQEVSQLELEKNAKLLTLELRQISKDMQDAYAMVTTAESALAQASEALRVNSDSYEVGMETLANLLDAQAQWQQAHSNLIEARANFKIKETEWLKATGTLSAEN
ncbi:MAG: TolC family protein [Prevotellaceae bacterium]|jgi:outer membrane protein TolC|nr:TolC family protein [Prevotellaceae bacterium]